MSLSQVSKKENLFMQNACVSECSDKNLPNSLFAVLSGIKLTTQQKL